MNTLSALHLKKSFKKKIIVNAIDLYVRAGECIGLLGPNGAGKTTSFYLMVGLLKPDEGKIFLNEEDITQKSLDQRARLGVGYLPQEASIFRKLSVENNILAILEQRKDLSRTDRRQLLEQLLEEFHITAIRKTAGIQLSGGERRRVEIARTLALNPSFILLDEPFAGVDPISVLDIKQIIKQLCNKNIGILITDHNVRETLDICTRAYIMHQGKHLCEGSANDILKNQAVRDIYLGKDFNL